MLRKKGRGIRRGWWGGKRQGEEARRGEKVSVHEARDKVYLVCVPCDS